MKVGTVGREPRPDDARTFRGMTSDDELRGAVGRRSHSIPFELECLRPCSASTEVLAVGFAPALAAFHVNS